MSTNISNVFTNVLSKAQKMPKGAKRGIAALLIGGTIFGAHKLIKHHREVKGEQAIMRQIQENERAYNEFKPLYDENIVKPDSINYYDALQQYNEIDMETLKKEYEKTKKEIELAEHNYKTTVFNNSDEMVTYKEKLENLKTSEAVVKYNEAVSLQKKVDSLKTVYENDKELIEPIWSIYGSQGLIRINPEAVMRYNEKAMETRSFDFYN